MLIRLALRHEGQWWNAYIAQTDTMKGATLIGSVLIDAVAKNPERKQVFMTLMQDILADATEVVFGERPEEFETQSAPEAERSGNA